jgi:hypothetical protein
MRISLIKDIKLEKKVIGNDFSKTPIDHPAVDDGLYWFNLVHSGPLYKEGLSDQAFSSRNQRGSASFFHVKHSLLPFLLSAETLNIETLLFFQCFQHVN